MTTAASCACHSCTDRLVPRLRELAVRALGRMYVPDRRCFVFRVEKTASGDRLVGVSRRYTATALIALAEEPDTTTRQILADHSVYEVYDRLLEDLQVMDDLGEVALTLWAGRLISHPGAEEALRRLQAMAPDHRPYPTVEVAWCLTALSARSDSPTDPELAKAVAERLLASLNPKSRLFSHWPAGMRGSRLRAHVACFADLVYPIQALSDYHRETGRSDALDAASRCAEQMCRLQGDRGQWWWHYDVRTARVIERYPVYSVHQDSMAPMALRALRDAGGQDHGDAIDLGLAWLERPQEIGDSLIDEESDIIWRKVGRAEPGKLSRRMNAVSSRLHPAFRTPLIHRLFPPTRVDFESRPYHMGWILHAWRADAESRRNGG